MKKELNSENAYIKVKFPYLIKKKAPVSNKLSFLSYTVTYCGKIVKNNYNFNIALKIPVITACPCSKNISKYGAHNQRSIVTVNLEINDMDIDIEEIITGVENIGSCDIFTLVKREDEKYITETSYENPKFVEDIVRDISVFLRKHNNIKSYKILSENIESIHNHTAYAYIEKNK